MGKTAEDQSKILHQVFLFKQEWNYDPDFNFCIFIHLTTELNVCHCSSKKRNTLLDLEDLGKVDVAFMIYFFFPTEKGSAVLGLNGISQTQCAMELIKFCGNWMHELS